MNGGQMDNGPDGTPGRIRYHWRRGWTLFSNTPIYNDGAGGDNCGYNLAAWLTGSGTVEYHGNTTGSIPFNTLTNNLNIANPTNTFKGTWNIVSGILLGSAPGSAGHKHDCHRRLATVRQRRAGDDLRHQQPETAISSFTGKCSCTSKRHVPKCVY